MKKIRKAEADWKHLVNMAGLKRKVMGKKKLPKKQKSILWAARRIEALQSELEWLRSMAPHLPDYPHR